MFNSIKKEAMYAILYINMEKTFINVFSTNVLCINVLCINAS